VCVTRDGRRSRRYGEAFDRLVDQLCRATPAQVVRDDEGMSRKGTTAARDRPGTFYRGSPPVVTPALTTYLRVAFAMIGLRFGILQGTLRGGPAS
jgi:hypothetical protein